MSNRDDREECAGNGIGAGTPLLFLQGASSLYLFLCDFVRGGLYPKIGFVACPWPIAPHPMLELNETRIRLMAPFVHSLHALEFSGFFI